jgi:murein DD-endopeptidase MepM/ murein hydrolase activator NlpD
MPKLIYPLDDKERTRTYHSDGRKFGASRDGRLHAGCDMLAPEGTRVRAMADGRVVRQPYHFYEGTYAIEIEHPQPDGEPLLIRYGEVGKGIPRNVKSNATVKQGDVIAHVGKLKRSSMLHMEMYANGKDHSNLTGSSKYRRRGDLKDPTALLDEAPTYAQAKRSGASGDAEGGGDRKREAKEWDGIVDSTKTNVALNVRKEPRIISGEDPVGTLPPDAQIKVLSTLTGGAHPFGTGSLWHQIRIPPASEPLYVIAHFIKTNMPMLGVSPMAGLPTTGHVTGVQTNLNIRSGPRLSADLLYKLALDTEVTIHRQITGDEYSPGRNDWVEIEVAGDATKEKGYAAAFYISPGEKADPRSEGDMGEWERVLVENDWPGRKSGGRTESERLARFDVDIVRTLSPLFQGVANKYGVPAALLAGIASRESGCGRLLDDDGWGDRGNAFGIMQVDKRYHTIRNRSEPSGHEHVEQATGIFCGFLDGVRRKHPGWPKKSQLHGATAAYNFGLKNVQNEDSIDVGSTNDDYGGDTLARAKYFYDHPDLRALR